MEYLVENIEWLEDELDGYGPDDYLIFDCPGQIELYTHLPVFKNVVACLKKWDYYVCCVNILDRSGCAEQNASQHSRGAQRGAAGRSGAQRETAGNSQHLGSGSTASAGSAYGAVMKTLCAQPTNHADAILCANSLFVTETAKFLSASLGRSPPAQPPS